MPLPESAQKLIDWHAPWLSHLPKEATHWAQSDNLIAALNAATKNQLKSGSGRTLTFIPQSELPEGEAYEAHIFRTGGVPTRLNLHDFFNACIWLTFPKTKAVLNARQAEQISQLGIQNKRGLARDALTIFDENASVLVTSDSGISNALRDFDWQNALVSTRSLWDDPIKTNAEARAALYPFGHALLEKLTAPYKAICTHTWVVTVEASWFGLSLPERLVNLDEKLAEQLAQAPLNPRDFCPLPILGVPNFWADNANQSFYNDAQVFRAGRTRLSAPANPAINRELK